MVRCTTLTTACTTTPGGRTTLATTRARKKAGTVSYTVQVRIKKNGAQVYQESQTFARRKAAEAWAKGVYLGITNRLKDIYSVDGFNRYPAEIEAGLFEHPAIAQAAVPDERRGDACR